MDHCKTIEEQPTPLTDSRVEKVGMFMNTREVVPADFARGLERKIAGMEKLAELAWKHYPRLFNESGERTNGSL